MDEMTKEQFEKACIRAEELIKYLLKDSPENIEREEMAFLVSTASLFFHRLIDRCIPDEKYNSKFKSLVMEWKDK